MSTMEITEEGETDLVVTRLFRAPPERVFRAHVEPDLVARWMNVGEGWTMEIVSCDARPGGAFRYDYAGEDGAFTIEGTFLELEPPGRILHAERMVMGEDGALEMRIETLFEPHGPGTRMVMRIRYEDAEARAAALAMDMAEGIASTYDALDEVA